MGALAGCWRAAPPAQPVVFFLSMAHTLPALPYGLDALEPNISRSTLEFHHGKHHAAYVTNLNNLVAGTDLEAKSLEDTITAVAGDAGKAGVFNNAAQVWNHSFYWQCMKPGGGGQPTGALRTGNEQEIRLPEMPGAKAKGWNRLTATRRGATLALSLNGAGAGEIAVPADKLTPVLHPGGAALSYAHIFLK